MGGGSHFLKRSKQPASKPVRGKASARAYPGFVRIIGGTWRSRRLPVLVAPGLRPTPDRVRETLFNWLAPFLPGSRCLDLYAGTGALCFEALSRGAAQAVMVERDEPAARMLTDNLARLKAQGAEVVRAEALTFLAGAPRPFDIIFIDPPFAIAAEQVERCARLIDAGDWITGGGLVYLEIPAQLTPLPLPAAWTLLKSKTTGQVGYHLMRMPGR